MKKISALFVLIIITFTFAAVFAMSKAPAEDFTKTDGWKKIDLRAKGAWMDYKSGKTKSRGLEFTIKTTHRLDKSELADLKDAGFKKRTTIGKIMTGSAKTKNLPEVANLEFMEAMELAVPMSFKKR